MAFSKIRDVFLRLAHNVHREINVYKIEDFNLEPPEIKIIPKRVKIEHANLKIPVTSSNPFDIKKPMTCSAKNYKIFNQTVKSKNVKIKKYFKQDVKTHKTNLDIRPKIYSPLKQVQALPQERSNKLKLQKNKINVASNEMLLACYGPIVEGAVDRLVLNKQQGTLLVWYSSSSRQRKARNVYLIRRLGMNSKPEWRWQ